MRKISLLILLIILLVLSFGCGNNNKNGTSNNNNALITIGENEYQQMTIKELKVKCEEISEKQKNEKEPKEEKIYFELSNVYLADDAKILDNWDYKKTQIANRSESIVLPGVFSEKTIKKIGETYKIGQPVSWVKGVCIIKKRVSCVFDDIELKEFDGNKKENTFNKDKDSNKLYKDFVEAKLGSTLSDLKKKFKMTTDSAGNDRDGYRTDNKLADAGIQFSFIGEIKYPKELSKIESLDKNKVDKAKKDAEIEQENHSFLEYKEIPQKTLLKLVKKPIYVNGFEAKVNRLNNLDDDFSYEDVVDIMGTEGYLRVMDSGAIVPELFKDHTGKKSYFTAWWYGKANNKIIVMSMTFKKVPRGGSCEWLLTNKQRVVALWEKSEDRVRYYVTDGNSLSKL